MTEPLSVQIQLALTAHLQSPELTSPATPIAFAMGGNYAPVTGTAYLDVKLILPAQPQRTTVGDDEREVHRGILQIDVVAPKGGGEAPGLRLAEKIVERFPSSTRLDLTQGRLKVSKRPWIAKGIDDGAWVRYPVSIPYFIAA